jgi:sterol desaturase/sphingolipid hydroxylase (fatty acid hydroxylase superfamily)
MPATSMSPEQKLHIALNAAKNSSLLYAFWYVGLAFLFWVMLYVLLKAVLKRRKISGQWPLAKQMTREAWHSLRSILVYGLVNVPIVYAIFSGWTRMYFRVDDYGWLWYVVSIGVIIVIHDTYFYWTHRAMHHPRLYRVFHKTHHLSTDPTPWAAYAFSPWEAAVQAGIAPVIIFTVPVHPGAFGLFMIWQISFNVLGHCGYEMYPKWFLETPLGYFLNTATHHGLHHEKFRGNYSLYFNVWDRLMGTNRADYEQRFAQATGAETEIVKCEEKTIGSISRSL